MDRIGKPLQLHKAAFEIVEAVELASEVDGPLGGNGELLGLCSVVLKSMLPTLVANPPADASITFVTENLLHPKACSGTIKQAEESEMIVCGGIAGQLDDWS